MKKGPEKILVLSIWEDMWELGEESGPSDEFHFIRYLTEKKGIELHFLVPEPPNGEPVPENPLLVYHTYPNIFRTLGRLPRVLGRFIGAFAVPRAMLRAARPLMAEIDPDIVVGFTYYSLYPLNRLGEEYGVPTVNKFFGVMYLDRRDLGPLKYWWYNCEQIASLRFPVDHYIVLNDGTRGRKALEERGVPPGKISFLPNGMDLEWLDVRIDPAEARSGLGLPSEGVIISTLSRLVRSKRVDLFLEAASRVDPALLEGATLLIGGDGPERPFLERRSRALGLEGRVIFAGAIKRGDLPSFYKASDVFVATNELTNMSLPPCEAMLCGVPVAAFDVSGTSEMIRDGETGLLAEDGDVGGLARRIELLVRDEGLRRKLGRRAAEFGAEHLVGWDDRIQAELDIFERMLRP
ncbi:MAG TPA: glycosyltransferase family 1 protein [Candidatus Eisenbacteria bacterium]|uniref:Glycosyltransferase family 1 protein n=1 Tax=Eiseniibacteriota bacterium TaxID=2212470 RepID=A0A7V2AVI9_UNCEI|nr:glycosyltransferase family 1 protein [Candidatus Eisenbacteria bacterium]